MLMNRRTKRLFRKTWHFLWEDDSISSWIVNIVLAFVIIKYLVYPGLGLIFATSYPVVAVVSESMEHNTNFDSWWESNKNWYLQRGITKDDFEGYIFKNGFNKGDIMILYGTKVEKIKLGDVIVFKSKRPDPIIHRVVHRDIGDDGYVFMTKGDNNRGMIRESTLDETNIREDMIIGRAVFRIPFLGYVKIAFVELMKITGIVDIFK